MQGWSLNKMNSFFEPKSIALIGASDHKEKVGGILMEKLLNYQGRLIPVNPNHESVLGIKCYSTVKDYKEPIDLAVIAVPSKIVQNVLEQCGEKKIKSVIIISAGFSEIGNNKLEEQLLKISKRWKINILGPNCFGICNPEKNLDTTFSATTPNKGDVAFISQSGALWSYISDFSINKFGFSGFASLGNMAGLGFSEFIEYFSKDKSTKAIVLYIEKLKDGKEFMSICKNSPKPIYAVKAGSSEKGSEAAFSHTASLASDYRIYKGAFKQSNVNLCSSITEAFEKASGKKLGRKNSATIKEAENKRAIIITNAGGAGALISDYAEKLGIKIIEKPIDLLGTALADDYKNALEKIDSRKDCDSVIIIFTPQKMSEPEKTARTIIEFKNSIGKQKLIISYFLGGEKVQRAANLLRKEGVICFTHD